MKKFIILSTLFFVLFSCTLSEKPEFIELKDIKVLESTPQYITLSTNAFFLNPNDIGGTLKTDEIRVLVNDTQIATVSTEDFKVPSKATFFIPLKAKIPTDSLLSNKSIGRLIGSLFSKKMKVQYVGAIKYQALGFTYAYEIDKTENVKIKF